MPRSTSAVAISAGCSPVQHSASTVRLQDVSKIPARSTGKRMAHSWSPNNRQAIININKV